MRDIKFRAWDKQYKYMTHKVIVGNTCDHDERYTAHALIRDTSKLDYKCDENVWMNFDEHSEIVLMQYTGLTDKQGVEIYEGDILKKRQGNYKVGEVTFEFGMFCFKSIGFGIKSGSDAFTHIHSLHYEEYGEFNNYEVIGNKYENPELLEITND